MRKRTLFVVMVLSFQLLEANPYLVRAVAGKVVSKKAKQVLLQKAGKGKIFLNNLTTGKIKRVKLNLSKMVKMPKTVRGSRTKSGFLRDQKRFWSSFAKKFSSSLSHKNRLRIKNGKAPVVDRTWMKVYPEHKPFNGQKLEHHHLGKGAFAVPLPKGLHRDKGNSKFWH